MFYERRDTTIFDKGIKRPIDDMEQDMAMNYKWSSGQIDLQIDLNVTQTVQIDMFICCDKEENST